MTTSIQTNLKTKQVACPTCKKLAAYDINNLFRPFCSQRCKMIDLGEWANENFRIADVKPPGVDDDLD